MFFFVHDVKQHIYMSVVNVSTLCDASLSHTPCIGVIGGAHISQQCSAGDKTCVNFTYGASSDIMYRLRGLDTTNTCGDTPQTLGTTDKNGACLRCSTGCINGGNISTEPLVINDKTLNELANGVQEASPPIRAATFGLQTLHKIWGDRNNTVNNGVNSRNVYVSPEMATVQCAPGLQTDFGVAAAHVLILEAHGDKYAGKVPGVMKSSLSKNFAPVSYPSAVMPLSQTYTSINTDGSAVSGARVGGVVVTRKAYGPGVYNVLAFVPPTADADAQGRGYVFAIWPFHYTEVYSSAGADSQARGDLRGPLGDSAFPCYGQCDDTTAPSVVCPGASDSPCSSPDLFDAINHEIDIEVPSNANYAKTSGDAGSGQTLDWNVRGWNTMNVNTWVNDINNYAMNTGAYYQNVAAKASSGATFVSTDCRWHWYTIDWYVNNSDYTKNYVKVYFDDPFAPTGDVMYNGVLLPTKPTGKPVAETTRFVPTRAGRLNVGPWFGWWGYPANGPAFDTAYIGVAHISITPYTNAGFLFPQTYDQSYTSANGTTNIAVGFVDLYSQGEAPPQPQNPFDLVGQSCTSPPGPATNPPSKLSDLDIGLIVFACVVVVATVIVVSVLLQRKRGANNASV